MESANNSLPPSKSRHPSYQDSGHYGVKKIKTVALANLSIMAIMTAATADPNTASDLAMNATLAKGPSLYAAAPSQTTQLCLSDELKTTPIPFSPSTVDPQKNFLGHILSYTDPATLTFFGVLDYFAHKTAQDMTATDTPAAAPASIPSAAEAQTAASPLDSHELKQAKYVESVSDVYGIMYAYYALIHTLNDFYQNPDAYNAKAAAKWANLKRNFIAHNWRSVVDNLDALARGNKDSLYGIIDPITRILSMAKIQALDPAMKTFLDIFNTAGGKIYWIADMLSSANVVINSGKFFKQIKEELLSGQFLSGGGSLLQLVEGIKGFTRLGAMLEVTTWYQNYILKSAAATLLRLTPESLRITNHLRFTHNFRDTHFQYMAYWIGSRLFPSLKGATLGAAMGAGFSTLMNSAGYSLYTIGLGPLIGTMMGAQDSSYTDGQTFVSMLSAQTSSYFLGGPASALCKPLSLGMGSFTGLFGVAATYGTCQVTVYASTSALGAYFSDMTRLQTAGQFIKDWTVTPLYTVAYKYLPKGDENTRDQIEL